MAAIQLVDRLSSRRVVDEGSAPAHRVFLVLGLVGVTVLLALIPPVMAAWAILDSAGLDRLYRAASAGVGPLVHTLQAAAAGAAALALLWSATGAGR